MWIGTAQDVGHALDPLAVIGQIEGGTAQGIGLALMEELEVRDGVIRNGSFTDYLLPTTLDMPPVVVDLVEIPNPDGPYGVKGVGEPPTVVSSAAVAAALRDATGHALARIPVSPGRACRLDRELAPQGQHRTDGEERSPAMRVASSGTPLCPEQAEAVDHARAPELTRDQ